MTADSDRPTGIVAGVSDPASAIDRSPLESVEAPESAEPPTWGIGFAFLVLALGTAGAVIGASIASVVAGVGAGETSLATTVGSLAGMWSTYVAMIAFRLRRDDRTWAGALGLRFRPLDGPLGVVAGLVSSILVVQVVYVVLQLVRVLDERDLDRLDDPARALGDTAQGPAFLVLALLIGIGAPVIEEIVFRGFLQRPLIARVGAVPGIVITAVVFALVHLQPLQFPALLAFGLVLGALAHRTKRLGPSIVTHVVFNGLTLAALAVA